ncbi:MAG TPA: GTPase HflX [Flavobacteriales bacterium]|nr:GTPase HflX [Flavobacteriales bacterium]
MEEFKITQNKGPERAIIVGLVLPNVSEDQVTEYLDELEFLADTAGAKVIERFTQKAVTPYPKTFIGSGKLAEIQHFVLDNDINLVIFDDELSPSQLRNIETSLKVKILDRSNLILDIFAKRARTAHAKTQVELAQYQYLLPRLTGLWTHLERQKGGIGMRGPGETEIETDRRIIRDKIALLRKRLEKIDKQMATQRKNRGRMIRASLIGYTNVGKSTLMNSLTDSNVFAENKLFATLDTTVRKVVVKNLPFLLSDTVGFIRKLPHHLVESFKSTLDEVRESDVLIHVVDISHPNFLEQMDTVKNTLVELKVFDKPLITVFNKIDAFKPKDIEHYPDSHANGHLSLKEFKDWWVEKEHSPCVFVSVLKKTNMDELKNLLYDQIRDRHMKIYPHQMLY